jgi:hypothetical protein
VNKLKQTITLKIKYILTESVYSLDTESSAKPVTISSLSSSTCTIVRGNSKGLVGCTLKLTKRGCKTLAAESKTISFDVFKASSMSDAPDINNCYAVSSVQSLEMNF